MFGKGLLAAAAVIGVLLLGAGAYFVLSVPAPVSAQAMQLPVDPVPLVAETASGEKSFTIEVADDASERAKGLMFRQTMADDRGMLFIFEQTQPVGFWMKNTPMPLDLLFIGQDGRIRDILPGKPFSEDVISPKEPVRFVLEFKAGTSERAGIKVGDMLRHPAINEAPGASNPG